MLGTGVDGLPAAAAAVVATLASAPDVESAAAVATLASAPDVDSAAISDAAAAAAALSAAKVGSGATPSVAMKEDGNLANATCLQITSAPTKPGRR
jgi:hypothetical protein